MRITSSYKLLLFIIVSSINFNAHSDERSLKIDFDGSVVEGMNKKPLDSLSYLSDQDRRKRSTLYTVRTSYIEENTLLLKEVGYHK